MLEKDSSFLFDNEGNIIKISLVLCNLISAERTKDIWRKKDEGRKKTKNNFYR